MRRREREITAMGKEDKQKRPQPELKKSYGSPRWSMEIPDCSMPMTFDTYSKCAYNCLYCFSYFQKSHTLNGYIGGGAPESVNPEKVIRLFESACNDQPEKVSKTERQFFSYIQDRRIMQWGGLADEFDEWERRYGVTLELLKYFDRIDYPLSFSTKAAWWTEDSRYMDLFARHTHDWHVKVSIITMDKEKARRIEKGVPAPAERLEAIRRLADIGVHVTLRLRPYIIGVSEDYKTLIKAARDAGADSVTTEFFCMEVRANEDLKKRYKELSEVCGVDIYRYYIDNSEQNGYKRLNRGIKAPIIHDMQEYAHSLGMRFHVSDAFCRECNDACNCCGVPPEWNASQTGNLGEAIIIAREKGEVRWSDIADSVEKYFPFEWMNAAAYNTGSNKNRAMWYGNSMAQFLHANWNSPKKGTSPAKAYGGILKPAGRDENGDIIYRYALKKETKENP